MNSRSTLLLGITLAGLSVAIGAFGAHGLKPMLLQYQREATFELAVRYQFYHAFAIIITGILMKSLSEARLTWASLFFIIGIILFSGSLYILSLTGNTRLGMITPLGGVCFIAGWAVLAWNVWKK